jgi:hypothetical protein
LPDDKKPRATLPSDGVPSIPRKNWNADLPGSMPVVGNPGLYAGGETWVDRDYRETPERKLTKEKAAVSSHNPHAEYNAIADRVYIEGWALALTFAAVEEGRAHAWGVAALCAVLSALCQFAVIRWTAWLKAHPENKLLRGLNALATDVRWWIVTLIALLAFVALSPYVEQQRWPFAWQFTAPLSPVETTFTQRQVDEKIADAIKLLKSQLEETAPLKAQLNEANEKLQNLRQNTTRQIADAVAKATAQSQAQSDAPISVDKLPTTLRLLFKMDDIEEIEARNVIWMKLPVLRLQNASTLLGPKSSWNPVWAVILLFKKPIVFKEIHFDDHGTNLPTPEIMSNDYSRYVVVEFDSSYIQGVLLDIVPTNEHSK